MEEGRGTGRQGVLFCERGQKATETNVVADEVSHAIPPSRPPTPSCHATVTLHGNTLATPTSTM